MSRNSLEEKLAQSLCHPIWRSYVYITLFYFSDQLFLGPPPNKIFLVLCSIFSQTTTVIGRWRCCWRHSRV